MRFVGKMAVVPMLLWIAGCHSGPSAGSVKVGMSAQEVRTAFGNPLITGTYHNTIPGKELVQERWTYKQGDSALVILMENGKVKSTSTPVNPIPGMQKKIHEGMSRTEVRTVIGEPALGDNPKDPNPNPTWSYLDAVAPVETMQVQFEGDKVKTITVLPNGAYGMQ